MPTIRDCLSLATRTLRDAGLDTPELDAAILLAHALNISRAQLAVRHGDGLDAAQEAEYQRLITRRAAHEPVSHLTGIREFWEWPFRVTPDVLDPRPDSEMFIEAALERFPDRSKPYRILDLGTGSGCLLISLLKIFLNSLGVGVDIQYNALNIAKENAHRLGVAERALWLCSDWCKSLAMQYDLVVSNPPYIARADEAALSRSVREYEPHTALFGGVDGLDCYRALAESLATCVAPGGTVLLELGQGQRQEVSGLFAAKGWQETGCWNDLGGIERIIGLNRP